MITARAGYLLCAAVVARQDCRRHRMLSTTLENEADVTAENESPARSPTARPPAAAAPRPRPASGSTPSSPPPRSPTQSVGVTFLRPSLWPSFSSVVDRCGQRETGDARVATTEPPGAFTCTARSRPTGNASWPGSCKRHRSARPTCGGYPCTVGLTGGGTRRVLHRAHPRCPRPGSTLARADALGRVEFRVVPAADRRAAVGSPAE